MNANDRVYPSDHPSNMGITVRDHIAIKSPITYMDVLNALFDTNKDKEKIKALEVIDALVELNYKYADAMIEQSNLPQVKFATDGKIDD